MSLSPPALAALLDRVHGIGREVVAPHAPSVDQHARFPTEAFDALKAARLLSASVPVELGGMGLDPVELVHVCEALGHYCGSTAMIYAMHLIQVACIVNHARGAPFFEGYLRELVDRQLLLASATTEVGIGGDVRSSRCALEVEGDRFRVEKQAPVISYALDADAILVTCRRSPDARPGDQAHVLVRKEDAELVPLCGWDTLGFRGTCSLGFTLRARGHVRQVLPAPYAEIHARTMHPTAHTVWSALWVGIAADAMSKARAAVLAEARRTPGTLPPTALRLAEVDVLLTTMRAGVHHLAADYARLCADPDPDAFASEPGFPLRVNNLKVASSKLLIEVVGGALMVTGIAGYRNDSPLSLSRHLRDAYGAELMVSNDRILGQSSMMQVMRRDG